MAMPELKKGENVFNRWDLLNMAAGYKKLRIKDGSREAHTEPVIEYDLGDKIDVLEENNIIRGYRQSNVFTLIDTNSQPEFFRHGQSCQWDFRKDESGNYILKIKLSIRIQKEDFGIALVPCAEAYVSPVYGSLSHFHMFRTLVLNDEKAPALAREIAGSYGKLVVTWAELGLEGIKPMFGWFKEFTADQKSVIGLGMERKIFDPNPFRNGGLGETLYVLPEHAKSILFKAWRHQLTEFRRRQKAAKRNEAT